jgi:hypothetical protein
MVFAILELLRRCYAVEFDVQVLKQHYLSSGVGELIGPQDLLGH